MFVAVTSIITSITPLTMLNTCLQHGFIRHLDIKTYCISGHKSTLAVSKYIFLQNLVTFLIGNLAINVRAKGWVKVASIEQGQWSPAAELGQRMLTFVR